MTISADSLGSAAFRADYGIKYAYLAGAMYKGIASSELVIALGKQGLMGYLGTGGLDLEEIEAAINDIQRQLAGRGSYGMNLLSGWEPTELEARTVELYLRYGITRVEAAAFTRMTPSLVRYRLTGLHVDQRGEVAAPNQVLAKVSRPEIATLFLQPPPASIVTNLLAARLITATQAELSPRIAMADDICVEADSGGHTDQGVACVLMPAMMLLRDEMMARHGYAKRARVGAAGGIGTPHAAAAAFTMGADFILTGSINQCTCEAGTSASVKDLLQDLEVQDTAYAPAGDMFELGARVQVAKRGLFFPARANKLYELYQRHASMEEIDAKTRQQIQEKYFRRSLDEVWRETRAYYLQADPQLIAACEKNPKRKMAAIFKWYFVHTTRLALQGIEEQKVDYQIHCGPALGAFNQWVKGTELQSWRSRHVADIAERIMCATAHLLQQRFAAMSATQICA
jgi:trans-AT polyketide synthase, acyltransferase and oxidoreductase domains